MSSRSDADALVLGAGIAGLAAATRLAAKGLSVALLERRGDGGGKAFSHAGADGVEVDNGQHVLLGCCTGTLAWLRELGSEGLLPLQRRTALPFLMPGGLSASIVEGPLPAPAHLAPSILAYRHLSLGERLSILRALGALARAPEAEREAWHSVPFSALLARLGQTPASLRRFWEPLVVAACNEDVGRVAGDLGALVFRETFSGGRAASRVAIPRAGLSEVFARPALRLLSARGGRFLPGRRVARILAGPAGAEGVALADGGILRAGRVVSALPWDDLLAALPEGARADPFFARAAGLVPSPILGIHLWLDREAVDVEFACLLESPLHWVFNQSRLRAAPAGPGQRVSLIVSASRAWEGLPRAEILERSRQELARFFPRMRETRVARGMVYRERRATFAPLPGSRAARLPTATPIPGLLLAGAWTDTGWPATIEGAVRSGLAAADAAAGG